MATSAVTLHRDIGWPYRGTVEPKLTVELENFSYEGDIRRRPKKIGGVVWDVGARGRDELVSICDLRSDRSLDVRNPTFGIGGHLIAVSLNGVDAEPNIVPVTKHTNDKMSAVEVQLRKLCAGPRYLEVHIPSYYGGEDRDPRVPRNFIYYLYDKPVPPGPDNPCVFQREVTQDWLTVCPAAYDARQISAVQRALVGMRFSAWLVENVTSAGPGNRDLTFLKGHLPPPDKRPLAFMDYLMLVHSNVLEVDANTVAEYVNSIGLGEKFPKPARQLAIFGNILKNDNWLRSDVYGDPSAVLQVGGSVVMEYFPLLVAGGGLNAPHVDHIVPQSLGGPNCFSNAQITSHSYNVQKGNHTQSLGFRSEEWKKEMMQRWNTDPNFKDHTH